MPISRTTKNDGYAHVETRMTVAATSRRMKVRIRIGTNPGTPTTTAADNSAFSDALFLTPGQTIRVRYTVTGQTSINATGENITFRIGVKLVANDDDNAGGTANLTTYSEFGTVTITLPGTTETPSEDFSTGDAEATGTWTFTPSVSSGPYKAILVIDNVGTPTPTVGDVSDGVGQSEWYFDSDGYNDFSTGGGTPLFDTFLEHGSSFMRFGTTISAITTNIAPRQGYTEQPTLTVTHSSTLLAAAPRTVRVGIIASGSSTSSTPVKQFTLTLPAAAGSVTSSTYNVDTQFAQTATVYRLRAAVGPTGGSSTTAAGEQAVFWSGSGTSAPNSANDLAWTWLIAGTGLTQHNNYMVEDVNRNALYDSSPNGLNLTLNGTITPVTSSQTKYGDGASGFSTTNFFTQTNTALRSLGDLAAVIAFRITTLTPSSGSSQLLFSWDGGGFNDQTKNFVYAVWANFGGNGTVTYGHEFGTLDSQRDMLDSNSGVMTIGYHTLTVRRINSTKTVVVKLDGVTVINATYTNSPTGGDHASCKFSLGADILGNQPLNGGEIHEFRIWKDGNVPSQLVLDEIADPNNNNFRGTPQGSETACYFLETSGITVGHDVQIASKTVITGVGARTTETGAANTSRFSQLLAGHDRGLNAITLTVSGNPQGKLCAEPRFGWGYNFDGTSSQMLSSTSTILAITGDVCGVCAFEIDSFPSVGNVSSTLFGWTGNGETQAENYLWWIGINPDGKIWYFHENSSGSDTSMLSDTPLSLGFHTVTLRRDSATKTVVVKVDDVVHISGSYTDAPDGGTSGVFSIGAADGFLEKLDGAIYEVRVWNRLKDQSLLDQLVDPDDTTYKQTIVGDETACYLMDLPGMVAGNNSFFVAGWFWADPTQNGSTNDMFWLGVQNSLRDLSVRWTGTQVQFFSGTQESGATVTSSGTTSTRAWHFVLAWYDKVAGQIKIQIDNGTIVTAAHTTGPSPNSNFLRFFLGTTTGTGFHGRLQSWCFGRPSAAIGGLISAINTSLWNSGSPKDYPSLTSDEKSDWGLVSYWDFDEGVDGMPLLDKHSSNHCGDIGTVFSAAGKNGTIHSVYNRGNRFISEFTFKDVFGRALTSLGTVTLRARNASNATEGTTTDATSPFALNYTIGDTDTATNDFAGSQKHLRAEFAFYGTNDPGTGGNNSTEYTNCLGNTHFVSRRFQASTTGDGDIDNSLVFGKTSSPLVSSPFRNRSQDIFFNGTVYNVRGQRIPGTVNFNWRPGITETYDGTNASVALSFDGKITGPSAKITPGSTAPVGPKCLVIASTSASASNQPRSGTGGNGNFVEISGPEPSSAALDSVEYVPSSLVARSFNGTNTQNAMVVSNSSLNVGNANIIMCGFVWLDDQPSTSMRHVVGKWNTAASNLGYVLEFAESATVVNQLQWSVTSDGSSATSNFSPAIVSPVERKKWHFFFCSYRFNYHDSSGNGRHLLQTGSLLEATSSVTKYGRGVKNFTTSNFLSVNNSALRITGNLSATFAFRITSFSADQVLFTFGAEGETEAVNILYRMIVNTNGTVQYFHESGAGVDTGPIHSIATIGVGYHTGTLTRDVGNNRVVVKINGTTFIDTTYSNNPTGGTSGLFFAGIGSSIAGPWLGEIHELRIWDSLVDQTILDQIADPNNPAFTNAAEGTETALWFLDSGNTQIINVNNSSSPTTKLKAGTAGVFSGTSEFGFSTPGSSIPFKGRLRNIMLCKPSDANMTAALALESYLYNNGIGRTINEITTAGHHSTLGLVSYWACDEENCENFIDSHGTNNLTHAGFPPRAEGLESSGGHHLVPTGGVNVCGSPRRKFGMGIHLDGSTDYWDNSYPTLRIRGDLCVATVFEMNGLPSSGFWTLFCYSTDGYSSDSSGADNILYVVGINNTGGLRYLHENGLGVNTSFETLIAIDSSSNAVHGALQGTVVPSFVTSPFGAFSKALSFDGVNRNASSSGVNLGIGQLSLSGSTPWCIEARFQTDTTAGFKTIVAHNFNVTSAMNWWLGMDNNGKMVGIAANGAGSELRITSINTLVVGGLYSCALDYNGTTMQLWLKRHALLAHWKFEEGSGTISTDHSGHDHTITLGSGMTFNADAKQGSFSADFNNADGTVANSFSTGTTFTITFWVKIHSFATAGWDTILAQPTAGIYVRDTGKITYWFASADHFANTAMSLNTWYHIAIVNNAGSVTFYMNGSPDGTTTGAPAFSISRIGNDGAGRPYSLHGRLDDIHIYSVALSATEIADTMKGVTIFAGKLEAHGSLAAVFDNVPTLPAWIGRRNETGSPEVWDGIIDEVRVSSVSRYGPTPGSGSRSYNRSSTRRHQISSNSALQTGDIGFAIGCWVVPTVVPPSGNWHVYAGKFPDGNEFEYVLEWNRFDGDNFMFTIQTPDGTVVQAIGPTPTLNTWYFLLGWHDPVANTINLRIDNGPIYSASVSAGVRVSTGQFRVGGGTNFTSSNKFADASISQVFLAKPSNIASVISDMSSSLYNNGRGKLYSALSSQEKTDWGLVSYWNGNEPSAGNNLTDQHSSNTLAATNNPGVDVGPSQFNPGSTPFSPDASTIRLFHLDGEDQQAVTPGFHTLTLRRNATAKSVVIKLDGNTIINSFYADNPTDGSGTNTRFRIGGNTANGEDFKGGVFEFRIWDHLIDQTVLDTIVDPNLRGAENYEQTLEGTETACWFFEENFLGNMPTVPDSVTTGGLAVIRGNTDVKSSPLLITSGHGLAFDASGTFPNITNVDIGYLRFHSTSGTGARSYNIGSQQFQRHVLNHNSTLEIGNNNFIVGIWAHVHGDWNGNGFPAIIAKADFSSAMGFYITDWPAGGAGAGVGFEISATGVWSSRSGVGRINITRGASAKWHFIMAWFDKDNSQIAIQVDNGTTLTGPHSGGLFNNTTIPLKIAGDNDGAVPNKTADMYAGMAFIAKPTNMTAALALRAKLYNNGVQLPYSSLTEQDKTDLGLISWWPGDEAAGGSPRLDAHGGNDMAINGDPGPGTITGPGGFSSPQFCIECRFMMTATQSTTASVLVAHSNTTSFSTAAGNFYLAIHNSNQLACSIATLNGTVSISGTTTLSLNVPYMCAMDYDGQTLRLLLRRGTNTATLEGSTHAINIIDNVATLVTRIGCQDSSSPRPFTGIIDEVRISNTSRYPTAASFAPSSAGFEADANTLRLYKFDDINQSAFAISASGKLNPFLQIDNSVLDPTLNTDERLVTKIGYYTVRAVDASGDGYNGATGSVSLRDDRNQSAATTTALTTAQEINVNGVFDGYASLQSWTLQIPDGGWDLWASTDGNTNSTFTHGGNTFRLVRKESASFDFTLKAANLQLRTVCKSGRYDPTGVDHFYRLGDDLIFGIGTINIETQESVATDEDGAFAALLSIAQTGANAGYIEYLGSDGLTWNRIDINTPEIYFFPLTETAVGLSRIYIHVIPGAVTATWGNRNIIAIGKAIISGVPYASDTDLLRPVG
jgi:hypothetical protein